MKPVCVITGGGSGMGRATDIVMDGGVIASGVSGLSR